MDERAEPQASPPRELDFGQHTAYAEAPHRRVGALAVAVAIHVIAVLAVFGLRHYRPLEVGPQTPQHIGAFVMPAAQPTGTTGVKPVAPRPAISKTPKPTPVAAPEDSATAAQETASLEGQGSADATGLGGQAGPVRLTLGGNVQLLKKVVPVYPPAMQASHMEGEVVLDCVINRDGSIGDVTVVRSSGLAFEHAAVVAVRQWRYTPIPYEGILTVTLNFTLPR